MVLNRHYYTIGSAKRFWVFWQGSFFSRCSIIYNIVTYIQLYTYNKYTYITLYESDGI